MSSDSPINLDRDRLARTRQFLADRLRRAGSGDLDVAVPACEVDTVLAVLDSVLAQLNPGLTPAADKTPEDPFARVPPLNLADSTTPQESSGGSASAGLSGRNPHRRQSVTFATELGARGAGGERKAARGAPGSDSPLGMSRENLDEMIDSRFNDMPIASRVQQERDGVSPMDVGDAGPFALDGSGSSGSGGRDAHGVPTSYLALDPTQSRRKSAVCSVAPGLNLASPRRDGAEHLLSDDESAALFQSCVAAALKQAPGADFAPALKQLAAAGFDSVSDAEFEVLGFAATKCAAAGSGAERCCFVAVALSVLSKYAFMTSFGADAGRVAGFVLRVLEMLPAQPTAFTGPLRAAMSLHTLHLILSDARLGAQLTDIEIAAALFACLGSRAGNLCATNEFVFRSAHPYARWFPGWSPQEHVAALFLSESLTGDATNPFSREWWTSGVDETASRDGAASPSADAGCGSTHGLLFADLVSDLVLSTDTRHQQWLFRECSDLLKRSEASAKGRQRRGSIKLGDSSIIRVADMHRILRCLVHLCEYAYTLQPYDSFKAWLRRWRVETALQGAAEHALGLPVSYHCRPSTDPEAYHVNFMHVVVAPFTSMLAVVLPHSFTVALLDNSQRLAELLATKPPAAAVATADAPPAMLIAREAPAAVRRLMESVHCGDASSPAAAAAASTGAGVSESGAASPALFAVMRMIENRVRETVGGVREQQALMTQRAPTGGVEQEAVLMLRRAKPDLFRPDLRAMDDDELASRFVSIMSSTLQAPSACNFATDDFFALLLRIVRYLNAM